MKENNMQFPIPNEILAPYIREAVSVSIAAALGDGKKLVEHAVHAALAEKVGSDGKKSRYSSDDRYIFAEVLAKNKIQEIAKECINEMAESMRPQIRRAVEEGLKSQGGILAKALENALTSSLSARWGVTVRIGE